ncbi:MAG: U32 family peptidase [Betaproteobacteria bacterium]|nr:U32 family peptidase [Betaproteobacteria bacterium]
MPASPSKLELLAPARNADIGIAAIRHGADAVYIGGPAFGARSAAGNTVADIERLANFAHRYSAQVFVALNTILRDDELEAAARIAHEVYAAGADALIIQDMGLLELDLPPIALHASTQTDIRDLAKAQFLERVGFSQLVLARELSLKQIAEIAAQTEATLEFFIHGALCVSYSGQCTISHALTGRSANRGECAQTCRLPYSLATPDGTVIATNKHLLSLKDNDQTANLQALIDAGIRSFKIEGRLKDIAYVKNITAHYRRELDRIIDASPGFTRASAGRCSFAFMPDPGKTFNRGATDYFVNGRRSDISSFDTPKFAGAAIGIVVCHGPGHFDVMSTSPLNNGDGISFFDEHGELLGLRINRAEARNGTWRLHVSDNSSLPAAGTEIFRNLDHAFEKQLAADSAERRIGVRMRFAETADGFMLQLTDEENIRAEAHLICTKEAATNSERAAATLHQQLGKLGATILTPVAIEIDTSTPWYLPTAALNALRRKAVEALEAARHQAYSRPRRRSAIDPPARYPDSALSYLGNVLNVKARAFYARHGVTLIDAAFEADLEDREVALMTTKHCLRYSFNLCPKQVSHLRPEPMTLIQGEERLLLRFDCKKCEMQVFGKNNRAIKPAAISA